MMRQTMDYPVASVAVNEQILEVILTLGNNAVFMAYQINALYTTYACDTQNLVHSAILIRPVCCKLQTINL